MELGSPSVPEAPAPLCAVHPDARAQGTCARCGNFVCSKCLDPDGALPSHCKACREREGQDTMAWERTDANWLSRWWRTTRAIVLRPGETFARAQPGRTGRALGYAAVTGALVGGGCAAVFSVALFAMWAFFYRHGGTELSVIVRGVLWSMVLYPSMFAASFLLSALLRTLVYHGAAALLGGRGAFSASLWTTAYLHAFQVAVLPIFALRQLVIGGWVVGLVGYFTLEAILAVQLTRAAERLHGLGRSRARLAGWSVLVCLVMLGVAGCVGTTLFRFYLGP